MKDILVVSPDTIPLKQAKVNLKTNAFTAIGRRCYLLAKYLNADLAIPTLNYDPLHDEKINIVTYDYNNAVNKFSDELCELFKLYKTVIIQSTYGIGWENVLLYKGKVIVDGLAPWKCEYEYFSKVRGYDKNLVELYEKFMKRADIVLYANDNQFEYYKKEFYKMDNRPLIKVPNGMKDKADFLIFSPFYPWLSPAIYTHLVPLLNNYTFHFVGSVHPRFKGLSKDTIDFLRKLDKENDNVDISLSEEYVPIDKLPNNYHLALCFGFEDSLETKLASRTRILDLLDNGFHVITNLNDSLKKELGTTYKLDCVDTRSILTVKDRLVELIVPYKENTYNRIYSNLNTELTKLGVI